MLAAEFFSGWAMMNCYILWHFSWRISTQPSVIRKSGTRSWVCCAKFSFGLTLLFPMNQVKLITKYAIDKENLEANLPSRWMNNLSSEKDNNCKR